MSSRLACALLALIALGSSGCEELEYVDPATVELSVSSAASGKQLVRRCNYIPVLLGSTVRFSYHVEGDMVAHLEITRENIKVSFEDSSGWLGAFGAPSSLFAESFSLDDPEPPPGLAASLSSGCEPSSDWPDR
ncbi:MAG TPA: hypothetical protein VIW29_01840 [Polyangiaceae bacterium]